MIEDASRFVALAEEWGHLHSETSGATVFNSWSWQHNWWLTYGCPSLFIVVARLGGAAEAILPLWILDGDFAGIPVRRGRLLGSDGKVLPDFIAPLARREGEGLARIARFVMATGSLDVIDLVGADPGSPFCALMASTALRAGYRRQRRDPPRLVRRNAAGEAYLAALVAADLA